MRWVVWAIASFFRSKTSLVAENLCLRQQLAVMERKRPRPRFQDRDRRFWILASRWFPHWQNQLLVVTPETVLRWHRKGWKAYWRWRSKPGGRLGRKSIPPEVKALIRRMSAENVLWGQKRIQAELARLGFTVSARTVAKYMRGVHQGEISPGWRRSLAHTLTKSGPVTSSASRQSSSGRSMSFSSFIMPVGKSFMSEPLVTRPASGPGGKSSRPAVGIVYHRVLSSMTATAVTVRLLTSG